MKDPQLIPDYGAYFCDRRLGLRANKVYSLMHAKQSSVLHECCSTRGDYVGACRFFLM